MGEERGRREEEREMIESGAGDATGECQWQCDWRCDELAQDRRDATGDATDATGNGTGNDTGNHGTGWRPCANRVEAASKRGCVELASGAVRELHDCVDAECGELMEEMTR